MTFTQSIRTCLRDKYANFSDRAPRSEFWWFILFGIIASLVAGWVDTLLGFTPEATPLAEGDTFEPGFEFQVGLEALAPVSILVSLALVVPNLAVTARRLHDVGRSGWYQLLPLGAGLASVLLIALLPALFLLAIVLMFAAGLLLLWWLIKPSEPGPNRWGPNPFGGDGPPPGGGTYAASRVPNVER